MTVKNVSSSHSSEVSKAIKPTKKYLTLTVIARHALSFLAILSAGLAITSAILFFHMAIPSAFTALIIASLAFGIFSLAIIYPSIQSHLPEPLQKISEMVSSIVKEFFSLFMTLGAITYGLMAKNKDPSPTGDHPILLVHGYGMNFGHFSYLKYCLKKNNVGPIYAINLGNPFSSIDDYAKQISAKVDQIHKKSAGKVTIIGHSMGGVAAARYLANCRESISIEQLITLGSPLQGTYVAYLGLGKSAAEMCPHSPFLNQLEKDLALKDIPITTVGSQWDCIIIPNNNALFNAVPSDKCIFNSMGHNNYLFSDLIVQLILNKIPRNYD